jgi:hypothetical protein
MILVRAYSPLGFYPAETLSHPQGVFVLDDDLIYSAVPEFEVHIEGHPPDRMWINPAEIRLLSALVLSVQHRSGKVYAYPDILPARVELDDQEELTDISTQEYLKEKLVDEISSRESDHNPLFYTPVPQPPRFSEHVYQHNENASDLTHQREVLESIDFEDDLLIRGLGALLKSELLNVHQVFHTEACLSLYIAMEASMHIIYRRLEADMENPGPEDASRYLAHAFNNNRMPDRYFGEFYDDRIRTVHPNSVKFGAFPYAPLSADDYYDLYYALRSVYDFLVTGRIDPAFEGH